MEPPMTDAVRPISQAAATQSRLPAPLPLDPKFFSLIGGGLPKGGWQEPADSTLLPKGGWA
jgi:hypothetical protein